MNISWDNDASLDASLPRCICIMRELDHLCFTRMLFNERTVKLYKRHRLTEKESAPAIALTSLNSDNVARFFWPNLPSSPAARCCGTVPAFLSMAQLLLDAARTAHCGSGRGQAHDSASFLKRHHCLVTDYINTAGIQAGKRHSLHELSASTPRPPAAAMTQGKVGARF